MIILLSVHGAQGSLCPDSGREEKRDDLDSWLLEATRGMGFLQSPATTGNWFSNAFSPLQGRKSDLNSSHLFLLKLRVGTSKTSHFLKAGGGYICPSEPPCHMHSQPKFTDVLAGLSHCRDLVCINYEHVYMRC